MYRCLFIFLISLFVLSCGELELPQKDNTEQSTTGQDDSQRPNEKEDESGKDDNDNAGNDNAGNDNAGNDNAGNDENADNEKDDNGNGEEQDIDFGRARFTADGHLIIDERLYLSLEEFWYVSSATGDKPSEAQDYATAYSEGDLKDWRIPTADDVAILRDALACESPIYGNGTLANINHFFDEKYPGIYRERYLCEEATKTFDFISGSKVSAVGKNKTYLLRLVRNI